MKSHITHNEKNKNFSWTSVQRKFLGLQIKKSFLIQDVNKFINFN